jgi:hypothetical protein
MKSDRNKHERSARSGDVQTDARGHAVWHWATETARNIAISASQVLRRLDHSGLSLQDEPPQGGQASARDVSKAAAKSAGKAAVAGKAAKGSVSGTRDTGFNPYESRSARASTRTPPPSARGAVVSKTAGKNPVAKNRSPATAPSRSSWWRRLFRRG